MFEDESRPNAWLNNVKRVPSTSYQPESKLPACLLNAIKPPETWRSCKTVLLRCTAGRSGENQASSNKNAKRCRQRWHGTRTRKSTSTVAVVPKVFTKTYRKHRSELSGERHPRPNPGPLHVARRSLLLASMHHFLSRCSRKTLRGNHKNITFPEPRALVRRLRSICYPGREDRNVGRFCI